MNDEIERRKASVVAQETDFNRWAQAKSLEPQWAYRASLAAQLVPAYSRVLDLGAGAMDLERALPLGCVYLPCDLVRRDDRTILCDLNRGDFPQGIPADVVTMLGVLEYIKDPLALLRQIRALNIPLVLSYAITDHLPELDRPAQGWINNFSFEQLQMLMQQAGFALTCRQPVDRMQDLFKWTPAASGIIRPQAASPKKVIVLSYFNDANFGDRLGYHVINSLLPPDALVTHASFNPWSVPDEHFDLLILGIGNSLNAPAADRPELKRLIEAVPHTLGIFGTQYRDQYRTVMDPMRFDALLASLTTWWARYEEDVFAFGRGRDNVRHLGDFLISAFPNATPTIDRRLVIPADFMFKSVSLDRTIQQIQSYRWVSTARVHPMLCALTSAEGVKFTEQAEGYGQSTSGKFRSQLFDVFGRTYEEDNFFLVDRDAVVKYKLKVESNMRELKAQIAQLLA